MAIIQTHRLELIVGTADLVRAEMNDRAEFARLLNAEVPSQWPPPLNDTKTMEHALDFYEKTPGASGWLTWYFVLKEEVLGQRIVVGSGGFWGLPKEDGTVGVGFSILPEYQRKGYAVEAVNGLVGWAFSQPMVSRVIAETLPHLMPSIRVLEKNRFSHVGPGEEPGSVRYELPHAIFDDVWQRRSHL